MESHLTSFTERVPKTRLNNLQFFYRVIARSTLYRRSCYKSQLTVSKRHIISVLITLNEVDMFSIKYYRGNPTKYVQHFSSGKIRREGKGLSFFYVRSMSSIVSVPLESTNVPFIFNESTADFQSVSIQGQIAYRISDPQQAAEMLDFTLDYEGNYLNDDYQKMPERIIYALQNIFRTQIQSLSLKEALTIGDSLSNSVIEQLRRRPDVTRLGVELLSLTILGVQPTSEMAKALEAAAREELNKKSDEAIYARRNFAIEQERLIKQNEIETDFLTQRKKQELKELAVQSEIALERSRATLIEKKCENERKEADAKAYTLSSTLEPVKGMDWRVLMMLNPSGTNAGNTIALAFQELATNAQKIGELNVSPDLLKTLINSASR